MATHKKPASLLLKALCFCIAGCMAPSAMAQFERVYKRDSAIISRSVRRVVELPTNVGGATYGGPFGFKRFVFKDVRADTSYVGVRIKVDLMNNRTYEKLVFPRPTATELERHFNDSERFSFDNNADNLTCFIRHLNIVEIDSVKDTKKIFNRLYCSIEAYLQRDSSYFPAMRLDTTIIVADDKDSYLNVLSRALSAFCSKASSINIPQVYTRWGYSKDNLEKRYSGRLDKPILSATTLVSGVYKTFAEFVNNNPSVRAYKFEKDRRATILYTQNAAGEWLPERQAFGLCDGNFLWINVRNRFYPLIRQGNTFEFLAAFKTKSVPFISIYDTGIPEVALENSFTNTLIRDTSDDTYDRRVYQLNMETGAFY